MSRHLLKDVTFIIPYYMDTLERYENLGAVLNFINSKFTTNIMIVRYAGSYSKVPVDEGKNRMEYLHITGWDGVFHRTHVINEGIKYANTKYVAIYDCDCVFEKSSIMEAVDILREGAATLVYPYGGKFVDIDRAYVKDGVIIQHHSYAMNSYGGACFLNRLDYFKCGLENENLPNAWCHDDVERYHRVKNLGFIVKRVLDGTCYHILHPPSEASKSKPSDVEYEKVKSMGRKELYEYVNTWQWAKM